MSAPTMSIETVQVIRPIKIIAFICGLISIILLIVALAGTSWIEAQDYKQGLWKVCIFDNIAEAENCGDPDANAKGWLAACAAMCIISLLVSVAVVVLAGIGLKTADHTKKYKLYKAATFVMFGAFLFLFIALVIFPVMFIKDLDQKSEEMQITEWYFAWTYGIAWGAAIFQIGCAVLLLIDKENDEIYYKEKTTYRE